MASARGKKNASLVRGVSGFRLRESRDGDGVRSGDESGMCATCATTTNESVRVHGTCNSPYQKELLEFWDQFNPKHLESTYKITMQPEHEHFKSK